MTRLGCFNLFSSLPQSDRPLLGGFFYFSVKLYMDEWYFPITILPGVGLLIMSTTHLTTALSNEIASLLAEDIKMNHDTIEKKIGQLSRLNISLTLFYACCSTLVLSVLLSGLYENNVLSKPLLFLSVIAIFCALALLIVYSAKAVTIQRHQFKSRL